MLACAEVLPVRDLQTFAASINPKHPAASNLLVARQNSDTSTKDYWLARATGTPYPATAVGEEPVGTLVVKVRMRASLRACSPACVRDLTAFILCALAPVEPSVGLLTFRAHHKPTATRVFFGQVQWYAFVPREGNNFVYRLAGIEPRPQVVESLLWTGSPISFTTVRGGAGGGRYVLDGSTHARIVKYANWNGAW